MGCDIHMYAEKLVDGKWQKLTGFKTQYSEGSDHPYEGRNYTLFAKLAGVRNGEGFAGCDTGDAVVPISEPRGLPEDVSEEVMVESEEWGIDGHGRSWLSLSEVLSADLGNFQATHRGYVDLESFKHFMEHGRPDRSCGMVSGGMTRFISNDSMRRIAGGEDPEKVLEFERKSPPGSKHTFDTDKIVAWFFIDGYIGIRLFRAAQASCGHGVFDDCLKGAVGVLIPGKLKKIEALEEVCARGGEEADNARLKLEGIKEGLISKVDEIEKKAMDVAIGSLYTRVEWVTSGKDSYGDFMTSAIPQLMASSSTSRLIADVAKGDELATTKPDPDVYSDIRVVFWFDN